MSNSKHLPDDTPLRAAPHPAATIEYQYDDLGSMDCVILSGRPGHRPIEDEQHPDTVRTEFEFDAWGRVTCIIQSGSG